ncbi:MAG: hypothetical protein ACTTHG_03725 [Treponemataceae bacterium]
MKEERIEEIIAWRDFLATMDDDSFFDIIHMYLGEVKTPYNKQKLIEELSSFLRKSEHRQTIVSLLDEKDIVFLNAIYFIPQVTKQKLISFFQGTFSFDQICGLLRNFEERLLIFRKNINSSLVSSEQQIYKLNPLLDGIFEKILDISFIVKSEEDFKAECIQEKNDENQFKLNQLFFASVYSLVNSNSDLCKIDGSFKKKISTQLKTIFPAIPNERVLILFITACKNLLLFVQNENGIFINKKRWQQFAKLTLEEQIIYIIVASTGCYSQSQLQKFASQIGALTATISQKNFTKNSLIRLAYLIGEKTGMSMSRLSQFLSDRESASFDEFCLISAFIENAIQFNVLKKVATNSYGEDIYTYLKQDQILNEKEKFFSIDASFSAFAMEGGNFLQLLEVADTMEFVCFDSILQFELTKKSCMNFFKNEKNFQDLVEIFKKSSIYELPQNLVFSIKEWYEQYNSVRIYHGFVMQAEKNNRILIEKNPEISKHIKKVLSQGIYLMDYENYEELKMSIDFSKLDFFTPYENFDFKEANFPFKNIICEDKVLMTCEKQKNFEDLFNKDFFSKHSAFMNSMLSEIKTNKEQLTSLQDRIRRKIIITKEQLRPESVKIEKLEAFGMDFSGKIHVIENAITNSSFLEFTYDNDSGKNETKIVVVKPVSLERTNSDAFLTVISEHDGKKQRLCVGSAKIIRRLL